MKTQKWLRELPLHLMVLPSLILVIIFSYIPMFGLVIAFQKFTPAKGFLHSPWIGLKNFKYVMDLPDTLQVTLNTIIIATMKICAGLIVPVLIALLLNEIHKSFVKRSIQTFIYLPHFLSWVILGGILTDVLSPSSGMLNQFLGFFGIDPIFFLANNHWFRYVLVISDLWKEVGFSTIIYLAALTGVNPTLYEAAVMDGANRWKQTWNITLPGIMPIVILMTTLSLGNVLNAGFEQVFNLYNSTVYETGDILDTLIYRIGVVDSQYGVSTAIGLLKSTISLLFISVSYWLSYRFSNYRVF